jgi:hypothetical protein
VPRSAPLVAALLLVLLPAGLARAADPPAPTPRYEANVADALLVATHRLAVDAKTHRATGDLVFTDHRAAHVAVRTCVLRRDIRWHTCVTTTTAEAGSVNVTPLHFRRGSYVVHWSVAGTQVARWRFDVV